MKNSISLESLAKWNNHDKLHNVHTYFKRKTVNAVYGVVCVKGGVGCNIKDAGCEYKNKTTGIQGKTLGKQRLQIFLNTLWCSVAYTQG